MNKQQFIKQWISSFSWASYWTPPSISRVDIVSTDIAQTITAIIVGSDYDGISCEYSLDGSTGWTLKGTAVGNIYLANNLSTNTRYYWRIRFYKGSVYSSYSAVISSSTTMAVPTDIAAPNLWLRADDIAGNDGDLISAFVSREGNGYSFNAATTKRPTLKKGANGINGKNVLNFNGTANILSKSGRLTGAAGTVFAIVRTTTTQNNSATVLGIGDEATLGQKYLTLQAYNSSSNKNMATSYAVSGSDYAADRGSTQVAMSHIHLMRWQGDGSLVYKMGLNRLPQGLINLYQTSTARKWLSAVTDADNTSIGGSKQSSEANFFKGNIAEILSYDSDLTDADVAKVEFYLSWYYGLNDMAYAVFGDSIPNGVGASDAAHSFRELIGTNRGARMINSGINSTTLQNTVQNRVATIGAATDNNGRDTYVSRIITYKPDKVFILYGLNDIRLNDAAFNANNYENDLGEIVDGLISSGISAQNIIIGSPSYMNNYAASVDFNAGSTAKHQAYTAKCAAVATAKGTKYKDVYQYMIDNGADTLVGADGIHPNDAGHAAIATAFLSVL